MEQDRNDMSNPTKQPSDIAQHIRADLVKHVYRPFLSLFVGNTLASVALVLGFWGHLPAPALLGWFGLMLLASVFRLVVYWHYRKHFSPERTGSYGRYYTIGASLYGIAWGLAGVLLFPQGEVVYQLFLVILLVGVGAGAVVTKIAWLPSLHAYLPVSLLPLTIKLITFGGLLQLAMAFGVIAFVVVTYLYAIYANRDLQNTLKLRYENMDLLAQLRTQKEEAEHANIAKSKFLAAASHDLRQPLHALTLFTSALDEVAQSPKTQTLIGQINTSVKALQSLFDALLDISRLDAGTIKIEKTHFPLQPMLDKLANDYNPQAVEKDLTIHWPQTAMAVYSDINLYEQILRNYISNAIRYTPAGEIHIRVQCHDQHVTLEVIDCGVGIPKDKQQMIFNEFLQLNNPERDRSKGLGLGLAIVQRTADLLGHTIAVTSEAGKGATFSVQAELGDKAKIPVRVEPEANVQGEQMFADVVLVIDDEYSVLAGTQSLLQLWGYHVITAADQAEAIAKLDEFNQLPDAIIADYRLRDNRTGLDAVRAIHDRYHDDIPVLIVTGDIAAERLREVNDSGFTVLHKPVAPGKLRAFLRHAPSRKRATIY
jgi:signal transduction histidine kinase/ActR/RegA family two-component response regulator